MVPKPNRHSLSAIDVGNRSNEGMVVPVCRMAFLSSVVYGRVFILFVGALEIRGWLPADVPLHAMVLLANIFLRIALCRGCQSYDKRNRHEPRGDKGMSVEAHVWLTKLSYVHW